MAGNGTKDGVPDSLRALVSEGGRDAAANSGTAFRIGVGDSFDGRISFDGDRDWVRITLDPGYYRITLTGGTLDDPYLRLHTTLSGIILENDDAWDNDSEFVAQVVTAGTFYVSAGSFDDFGTGSYRIEVEEVPRPDPLDSITWGTKLDDTGPVRVWFARAGEFVNDGFGGVRADGFLRDERETIFGILDGVSQFADITFSEAASQASADLVFALDFLDPDTLGYFNPPNTGVGSGVGVFNSDPDFWYGDSLLPGGFMYGVILHELGHGLGMAHPHDLGGASELMAGVGLPEDTGAFGLNDGVYTLMSYNDGWTGGSLPNGGADKGYSAGYAALDIGLLQQLYGRNTTHASGDDTYNFARQSWYAAIWDTGGTDTLSGVGALKGVVIDLRAATLQTEAGGGGFLSRRTDFDGGYTIANGVVIERANGSEFADIVTGNGVANTLRLFGGADRGGAGGGNDTVFGGDGGDTLAGGTGNDTIAGEAGADRLTGDLGNDLLDGGADADFLYGGDGNDVIRGGAGNDQIDSGSGTDRIVLTSLAGTDRIAGFSEADLLHFSGFGAGFGFDDLRIDTSTPGAGRLVGGGVVLTFTGLTANLDAGDFLFT